MLKKIICVLLSAATVSMCLAACGQKEQADDSGKTVISVGGWPSDNQPERKAQMEGYVSKLNEKYPDIKIEPDEWTYDTNSFVPKASSGQLPTLYSTYLTEIKKIINAGYCAEITDEMKEAGFYDWLTPTMKDLVEKDGKIYGMPCGIYVMGLTCNTKLFKDAGLTDENGVPIFPKTYEELAKTASIIKEKTGKAGLILPTINNCGGWHFMNIAWSYGTKFMEQDSDGRWAATFDSPEAVAALQYVKDLKWKYNVLPDNAFVDIPEMQKCFATDQAAMYFSAPVDDALVETYSMPIDRYSISPMPAGPAGRYALTGGICYMFNANSTKEQIGAGLKWLENIGVTPFVNEEILKVTEDGYKLRQQEGKIVGIKSVSDWGNAESKKAKSELVEKYANIDRRLVEQYEANDNVTSKAEEPMNSQELYKILDACIQSVLTDKNADPAELIKNANSDFQKNYLDKIN